MSHLTLRVKFRSNSVTRLVTFNMTKLTRKCQNSKIHMRHLGDFQTLCTYVNSDTLMMVKNGDFGVVCRNVSVKLLLVEVPLDAVEVIAFEIVVTFENGLVPFQSMRRDHGVRQKLHTDTTCKSRMKKKVTLTSIMSCSKESFSFFSAFLPEILP